MKEYRIAKGWAIFIYIVAPLMIALFAWLLIMPFVPGMKNEISTGSYTFIAIMSVGMIALCIAGLIDISKEKFVIDHDKIFTVSAFSSRQLLFQEIKGYRVTNKYIFVEPLIEGRKRIKISTYLGKTNEITEWLASRYPDLDAENFKEEEKEILTNEEFGWSTEEREAKLKKARKTATLYNWTAGIIGAWTLFLAEPYEYSILASLACPLIGILLIRYSKGLIRINERKESAYPSIFLGVLVPAIAINIRALLDFNVFSNDKAWIPMIIIALVLTFLLVSGNHEFKFRKVADYFLVSFLFLLLCGYSYGAIITLNCYYDKSTPEIYNAQIVDKRISSGKTTSYYLKLTPWRQQKEADEVSVTENLFNKLNNGDEVTVYFKKGLFQIPWFILDE